MNHQEGGMHIKSFQDLLVWQKGHRLVLEIYRITKDFPGIERFGMVSQIRRSAVSICANIAGGGKKSTKDFARFLDIAEGSLEETKYHLILCKDLEYIGAFEHGKLMDLCNEIGKMLYAFKKRLLIN